MGIFDRFKKKAEKNKQPANAEVTTSNIKVDELNKKYDEDMRSLDEQEAETNRQLEHSKRFNAKVSSEIKNLNNAPGARKFEEMASNSLKKFQEEQRQEEFAKSLLGQKYATIRHYVDLRELGIHFESNFDQEIQDAAKKMEEKGYSLNYLLLPFLIEKKGKNLLNSEEKIELNSLVSKLSDEELYYCLADSVVAILFSEVFGPFKTKEDQEKAKLFITSFAELEYLKNKMEYSRK